MSARYAKELEKVAALVDSSQFITDAMAVESYQEDYSITKGDAGAVVFPKSAEQVAEILGLCNELGIPVVPSGGRSGFVGGAVPLDGALVISMEKMKSIEPVDLASRTVRVAAGVTTEQVIEHAKPHGLTFPIELAANSASQIGGNIATNAGGVHVVRYGMTRNWVAGIQVATMEGKLLNMERNLSKNNAYWDLSQLFIGSEGTLGIITSAVLKLAPVVKRTETLFLGVESLTKVIGTLEACRNSPFTLHAYEFMDKRFVDRVNEFLKTKNPLEAEAPYYVVLEFEVPEKAPDSAVADWFATVELDGVVDALVAQNEAQRAQIWRMRHDLTPAVYSLGPGKSLDVSVALSSTSDFVQAVRERVQAEHPDWNFFLMGHVADGNTHTHVVAPESAKTPEEIKRFFDAYEEFIYNIVVEFNGSISAEHGIGLDRRKYLKLCRSDAELEIYRGIKKVMDPKGLLNPGKVL